jgi:CubicO group peptidase (beta-lactamase class C family)
VLKGRLLALLICFVLLSPVLAQAADFLEQHPQVRDAITLLDLWIQEQMAYQQIPGLALGIVYDQEVIWSKGYGVEDLESREPVTPATLFRLGSVSKLFTATAILQLRDQGKLRLDDPVAQHLPWFELQSTLEGAPAITIRHLLTHTAGLPREVAFPCFSTHECPSREEIIAAVPNQRAVYPPNKTYKYSNLGMVLLGEIIVSVSGETFADYIEQHIFEPLGMTRAAVVPSAELREQMATSYLRRLPDGTRRLSEYYETNGVAPAASIVSSLDDLARFAALHLGANPEFGDGDVVKASTLHEMQRPHWVYSNWSGGMGLGFRISRREDKTLVSHGGWIGGDRTHFLLVPEEKLAVIAMVNAEDGVPYQFSYQTLDLVGEAIAESTAPALAERRADPTWEPYLGDYADPWGRESQVMILDERLVLYSPSYPPSDNAAGGITPLEPVGDNVFEIPDGGRVIFELDEEGRVEHIQWRSDYLYPADR